MKSSVRLVVLALLLACGAALVAALYVSRVRSPLQSTLTSSFQLLGAPVKLVDRVASRMVPVSALDERELGDTYRRRFDAQAVAGDADQEYLDALVDEIRRFAR